MVGQKLRDSRQSQNLSLTEVAIKARMSAATLSRIENDKQALDINTFFVLARILGEDPENLVSDGKRSSNGHDLADQITSLTAHDRAKLWRDLASRGKSTKANGRTDLGARIEELVAQVDFLRQEIETVRQRRKKRN